MRPTAAVAAARSWRRKLDSTGCDLAEVRRSHKLVESRNLNDHGADETSSQHREPRLEHALTVENSSVCGQIALVNSSAVLDARTLPAYAVPCLFGGRGIATLQSRVPSPRRSP
jgi:hypothetical protein